MIDMLPLPLPPQKQTRPSPELNQIIISKHPINQQSGRPPNLTPAAAKSIKKPPPPPPPPPPLLRPPRRTNPIIWCGAVLCLIFCILLIFAGITTLIIFIVIKPRYPLFDTTIGSLNTIYFDSPEYLNGDFTFLANLSNPNRKIDLRFEYLEIQLYFFDRLIATQVLEPFTQRQGEVRLESIHMISSLVYLPLNLATELQKQVQSNRIQYNIRGSFRVRASLGLIHFSYWLYGRCQVDMTGPPNGVLVARSCKTKR